MNKLISFFVFVFVLGSTLSSFGQARYFDERYIYSQHDLYPSLINAGAIGINDFHEVMINYRNTWAGFDQSPRTIIASYNGPIARSLGFGAQILKDSYASLSTTKGQIGFSYSIVSETNKLGLGLSTELIQHNLTGSSIAGPLIDSDDPLLADRLDGVQYFDASFGVYGIYKNKFTYGIAFPSLLSSRISDTGSDFDRKFAYIFQLGYALKSASTGISLRPSIVVKSLNNTPPHIDLNARFGFLDDKLVGGLSYTIGGDKRFGFLLGTVIESLHINYSYNISNANFQVYNNGAHEISIGYRFGEKRKMVKNMDMMELKESKNN